MAAAPKRGLGKGLGALIPSSTSQEAADAGPDGHPSPPTRRELAPVGAVYAELPIDLVLPNSRQPRTVFDEDALAELVFSIREIGLLQPVVVRRSGDGTTSSSPASADCAPRARPA